MMDRGGRSCGLVTFRRLMFGCALSALGCRAFWSQDPPTAAVEEQSAPSAVRRDAGAPPVRPDAGAARTAAPKPRYPPYAPHPDDDAEMAVPLEGPDRLDHYFHRLTLTELGRPGAITRGSHWGDSVLGGDGLTEEIRRRLQERFGDAGHGYHTVGKYSRWYRHRGVRYSELRSWDTCLIIYKCRADGRYGYAGASSISSGRARSRWETAESGPGSSVSRFELWFARHPKGGKVDILVDSKVAVSLDTRGDEPRDEVEAVAVPDGAHRFEVVARGGGVVSTYGVVLERGLPGAVWDELSLIGSFTQRLDYQDADHIARQVQLRAVDLMVFMLGGNDAQRERSDLKDTTRPYEAEYGRVIRKFRAGRPQASCIIMALIDHVRKERGKIETRAITPRLVDAQRKVAREQGCAFFDTFAAMGGDGSLSRWYHAKPRLAASDLKHPTLLGQRKLGALFYAALMRGYADFRRGRAGREMPEEPLAVAFRPGGAAAGGAPHSGEGEGESPRREGAGGGAGPGMANQPAEDTSQEKGAPPETALPPTGGKASPVGGADEGVVNSG